MYKIVFPTFRDDMNIQTKYYTTILILITLSSLSADYYYIPAAQLSMGNTGVASFSGSDGCFYNPAAIHTDNFSCAIGGAVPFQLAGVRTQYLSLAKRLKNVSCALAYSEFGNDLYRETIVLAAAAFPLWKKIEAGIGIRRERVEIVAYPSTTIISGTAGVIVPVTSRLCWGLSTCFASSDKKQQGQVLLQTGLSARVEDELIINCEVVSFFSGPPDFRAGCEWMLSDVLMLRAGFTTMPATVCGGVGFSYNHWHIDYGLTFHPELGITHSATARFCL